MLYLSVFLINIFFFKRLPSNMIFIVFFRRRHEPITNFTVFFDGRPEHRFRYS